MSTIFSQRAPTTKTTSRENTRRQTPREHLLDLELSVGDEPRPRRTGQSVFHDDRSSPRAVAELRSPEWAKMNFLQGIAGTLELFHRSSLSFQQIVGETTGHPVAVFQRIDQAGYKLPIDERVLADTDTLLVFGLDHLLAEQEAEPEEIEAIREWLKREGTCLLLAPHHDVGFTSDSKQRQMEYRHHGDRLVPRQQRFGQYTRSLMKALDVPVHQSMGASSGPGQRHEGDRAADGVPRPRQARTAQQRHHIQFSSTFAALRGHRKDTKSVHVLARQPIDPDRPHPFTAAGNTEFNCLLWMPPNEQRAGDILLVDSTHFTTLFGGTDSLATFWRNLALMK